MSDSDDFKIPGIQNHYVAEAPSDRQTADIFKGLWASKLPLKDVDTGYATLWEDPRTEWFIERLGDLRGKSVLELGPLEGAHTYMMTRAGANVLAIEANTNAYLRCLVAKELLNMENCKFLLGNFNAFIDQNQGQKYDIILCLGVLYHLEDPLLTLRNLMQMSDSICIWSTFYSGAIAALPDGSPGKTAFTGETKQRTLSDVSVTYHMRSYGGTSHGP